MWNFRFLKYLNKYFDILNQHLEWSWKKGQESRKKQNGYVLLVIMQGRKTIMKTVSWDKN